MAHRLSHCWFSLLVFALYTAYDEIVKLATREKIMPNPHPKTDHLPKDCSKWQNSKTTVIRIPAVFKEKILEFARELDRQGKIEDKN